MHESAVQCGNYDSVQALISAVSMSGMDTVSFATLDKILGEIMSCFMLK